MPRTDAVLPRPVPWAMDLVLESESATGRSAGGDLAGGMRVGTTFSGDYRLDIDCRLDMGVGRSVAITSAQANLSEAYGGALLLLPSVTHGQRLFLFASPLLLRVYQRDGLTCLESDDTRILAYAEDLQGAIDSLSQEVAVLWDAFVGFNDDALTKDAERLRQSLGVLVAGVKNLA